MSEALFHPDFVAKALAQFDGINDETVRLDRIRMCGGTDALPPAVFVRLLRRYRVDPYPKLEKAVQNALYQWIRTWVGRKYSGLSLADRQEMVQELSITVINAVLATTSIDWWEITFVKNLSRAAADHYEKLFDLGLHSARGDINDRPGDFHDDGDSARVLESTELLRPWLATILNREELLLVAPLLIWDIPISSELASIDAVRHLGMPEGTLREKKAALIKKIAAQIKKEAL